jgi:putative nucleotidyltransferase with HDIG domain
MVGKEAGQRIRAAAESGEISLPALEEARTRLVDGDPVAAAESDVALTLTLLKRTKAATVADAVATLGGRGAQSAAQELEVFDPLGDSGGGRVADRLRLHSVSVRDVATDLARVTGHSDVELLRTGAILHDVGKAVIGAVTPDYALGVGFTTGTPDGLRSERAAFGIDHAEAGALLLEACELPERLTQVVRHHHVTGDDSSAESALVALANMLAHYRSGRPVDPHAVTSAAATVGIGREDLGALLYDLAAPLQRTPTEPCPLSPGELAVVKGLARGLLYKEIAAELGLSPATVRNQIHRAYVKVGTRDRAQVVLIAHDRGWL